MKEIIRSLSPFIITEQLWRRRGRRRRRSRSRLGGLFAREFLNVLEQRRLHLLSSVHLKGEREPVIRPALVAWRYSKHICNDESEKMKHEEIFDDALKPNRSMLYISTGSTFLAPPYSSQNRGNTAACSLFIISSSGRESMKEMKRTFTKKKKLLHLSRSDRPWLCRIPLVQ